VRDGTTDEIFTFAVALGGIDHVDPGVQDPIEKGAGGFGVSSQIADTRGAKSENADFKPSLTQDPFLHFRAHDCKPTSLMLKFKSPVAVALMRNTLLIPYLGKRPVGFEHFAFSASFVADAEFLYLTDDPAVKSPYPNVRVIPLTLAEFNMRARDVIGCELGSNHPMKLCDFRPAFGLIFADLLRESAFWGYCDVDVLFGNMAPYLGTAFLSQYDVISMNANYLSGSFTLWRNDERINRLFERSPDWRSILTSPDLRAFDECGHGLWGQLNSGMSIFDVKCDFLSMTHVVRILEREGGIRPHFRKLVKEEFQDDEVLRWTPGRVATVQPADGPDHPYFHSVLLKQRPYFFMPAWDPMPKEIYISRSGYHRSLKGSLSRSTRLSRLVRHETRRISRGLIKRVRKLGA
jgi:hypothetical protein